MIIHILPTNLSPCGGIKVHYQICELENELGYTSIIAFPDKKIPTWFNSTVKTIVTFEEAQKLAYKEKAQGKDVLVIGWEDASVLNVYFRDFNCCCYIQGDVFWQGIHWYYKKHIVASNSYINSKLGIGDLPIIQPFVDSSVFYPQEDKKFEQPFIVLVQGRKGGREAVKKVIEKLDNNTVNKFNFVILDQDVSEEDFAKRLRKSHIFFTHSYPEGFGLPALEAMSSKTLVIGFTGGGGDVYMRHLDNCLVAPDGDYDKVSLLFESILKWEDFFNESIDKLLNRAYGTALLFNRGLTKLQIHSFLTSLKLSL